MEKLDSTTKQTPSTRYGLIDKKYRSIKSITTPVIIIAACFLLGIADMIFLRNAMQILFKFSSSTASFMALLLATVANFTALMWGKANGDYDETKTINRHSATSFALWLAIGGCYLVIRILNMLNGIQTLPNADMSQFANEIVQIVILAVLYIGTGITISEQASIIFDKIECEYRRRKKIFLKQHDVLSDDAANLQEDIGRLKGYASNYVALDAQYEKIKRSIRKAESAAMADIVGKTLKNHQEITPSEAHAVMNEILTRRD